MLNLLLLKFSSPILELPRWIKRCIVCLLDLFLCALTVWIAYYLRLGEFVDVFAKGEWAYGAQQSIVLSACIAFPILIINGLYRAIFRYSGWLALLSVTRAIGLYGLIYAFILTVIGLPGIPRTIGIIQPILLLMFVGASRAFARAWLGDKYLSFLRKEEKPRALIYGAGKSGRQLAAALQNNNDIKVLGFLDDDKQFQGSLLNGLPIFDPEDLKSISIKFAITDILLAMPAISRKRRNEILNEVRGIGLLVRTLPSLSDLAQGKFDSLRIIDLDLDDLLGRDPVLPDENLLKFNVTDKVLMVTGAGGSIGGELCLQILSRNPKKIILVDHSEYALYKIYEKLKSRSSEAVQIIVPILGSVQNFDYIKQIVVTWKPSTIFHAAAYKHVPLVEQNLCEGIKNNVLGSLNIAKAASENGVENVVLISTDKAVRPTSMMGVSKRLAEMIFQALTSHGSATKFCMVRFGNVLGSSGSVVPKFRQQIRDNGPITLTHAEIIRYFMTIPEAAQLVIQASAMADGGDVFVLDMGEPVKIYDLACRMIELSGLSVKDNLNPYGDIEIEITGLRPGEKLYEELLIGNNPAPTNHPKILRAQESFMPWIELEGKLNALEDLVQKRNHSKLLILLKQLVPEYTTSEMMEYIDSLEEGNTL